VKLIHYSAGKAPASLKGDSEGVLFEGSEGSVYVRRGNVLETTPASLKTSEILPQEIHLYESHNHAENFLDCIRTRRQTISPVEVAQRSTTISLLCDIAMRLGRKVNWDPVTETFPGDEAANRHLSRTMRGPWQV